MKPYRRIAGWIAGGVVTAAASASAAPVLLDPSLRVETAVSGLSQPTTLAFLPPPSPGDVEFLVLEKETGQVRRVKNGVIQSPDPALDLAVATASEQGLLGIAINSESPPKVFLYYTAASADGGSAIANRITRYTWEAGTGTLITPTPVIDLPINNANHDGGILVLDSASPQHLFAVIGDQNHSGNLQNHPEGAAPDNTGVILRMNQDGSAAAGNPFTPYCSGSTATPCASDANCIGVGTCVTNVARYYAYGVRNCFGMTFDPGTGFLWDTENGPTSYDEINRVPAGMNSGWNKIMGPDTRDPQGTADLFDMPGAGSTYDDPEFSWLATIAPTAILFPLASQLGPRYDAAAWVGDVNNGQIYSLTLNSGRTAFDFAGLPDLQVDLVADTTAERDSVLLGSGFAAVTDLKLGPDANVYVSDIGAGTVYRVTNPGRGYFTLAPCRLLDTRAGAPLSSGVELAFTLAGSCDIPPSGVSALSLNVIATQSTGPGQLVVFPGNLAAPLASTVRFRQAKTIAGNVVAALSTDDSGEIRVLPTVSGGGTVHLILDVNGYFE